MSATIQEVASALGVSVRGVRLRVNALDALVKPYLQRGANNQILFTGEAVGLLQRLEELRHRDGVSVNVAASILRQSQRDNEEESQTGSKPTLNVNLVIEEKQRAIERLEDENAHLKDEVAWLREQVDALRPLALPRPRRWFGWLHPRQVQGQRV